MASSTVLYENKDNIGIITLNRPERLNAINNSWNMGIFYDIIIFYQFSFPKVIRTSKLQRMLSCKDLVIK